MEELPIACNLETEALASRQTLLRTVAHTVKETRPLPQGYAFRFEPDDATMASLLKLVKVERECCPFLTFTFRLEPNNGPCWLEATGPEGTKAFLADLFGMAEV